MLYLIYCVSILALIFFLSPTIIDYAQWYGLVKDEVEEEWLCTALCCLMIFLFLVPVLLDVSWAQ